MFLQAKERRDAEAKAMKHELEVWNSEGRKEVAIRDLEYQKQLEVESIEAYKVKSAGFNVVSAHFSVELLFPSYTTFWA